ncbi:MAG: hypothetical protein M1837_000173 [Sclerophora amabilis]|nr:MAG: hypothetical protein M1837_000173 [Sclerophora amabilis]
MAPQPPSFPYMRPTMDPSTPSEQPIVSNQAMSNALLSPLSIPTSSGSHCVVPDLISVASDESPLTSSGSSGYSAVSDQFQPHFPVQTYNSLSRPRSTSTLSTPEGWYQVNKSPLPQSASISAWNLADATPPPPPQLMSPYDGSFYTSVGISAPGQISQERTQTFPAPPLRVPVTELDGNTFSELQCLMVGPTGLSMGPDGWCTRTMGKLDEYLDYYWQRFDKFIPIVHRPSFSKTKAPILVAIMAAIGALYAGTMESKSLAIDVHRRCKDFINTLESKQRAVLSAYLLDAHQATFFEQEPCQSTSYYGQTDLLFACPTPLWESQNANEWSVMCQNVLLPNQPCLRDEMFRFFSDHDNSNNSQAVQTPFESSLILAYTMTSNGIAALDQVDERFRCRLEERYSSSHNLLLTCNSFQVLRYAPLRELLAVTGETWVLGRKLSSPSEFAAAKDRLRSWATSPAASKATWHAAHVLRHAFQSSAEDALWGGLSGGLHEQWCVYTAALVCWAFGSAQQAPQKSSASSSSSSSCVVPGLGHERTQMWHYLTSLNTESWDEVAEVPGLWRTGEMLLCVKELVRGTMGGLLKDAEEVLTRLIDGRLDALRF